MKEFAEPAIRSLFFDPEINETAQLRMLLVELEKRSRNPSIHGIDNGEDAEHKEEADAVFLPEIGPILSECRSAIFAARRGLLSPFVTASCLRLDMLHQRPPASAPGASAASPDDTDLLDFVRAALDFAVPVVADEEELCEEIMNLQAEPEGPPDAQAEYELHIQTLVAAPLLDKLKTRLAKTNNIEALATACKMLADQDHALTEQDQSNRPQLQQAAFSPLLAEVRIKLVTKAQAALTTLVEGYVPEADDLDYPARLSRKANGALSAGAPTHSRASSSVGGAGVLGAFHDAEDPSANKEPEGKNRQRLFVFPPPEVSRTWYPSFRRAFELISQTHDSLAPDQVHSLGMKAVRACLSSLTQAAKQMEQHSQPQAPAISHSQLFLLRHILLLREMLVAIDVAVDRLQQEAQQRAPSASALGSASGKIDLGALVSALNSLWSSTSAFLDPRRLVQATARKDDSTDEGKPGQQSGPGASTWLLRDSAVSEELEDALYATSTAVEKQVVQAASAPLHPFTTASTERAVPDLTSLPATSREKAIEAYATFKRTAPARVEEAREAFRLFLEDEASVSNLHDGIVEQLSVLYLGFVGDVTRSYGSLDFAQSFADIASEARAV